MSSLSYEQWLETLAAYWLRKGKGGFFLRAVGSMKDRLEFNLRAGVASRFPDFADERAQAVIGDERQLERYPGMSRTDFAERLKQAFELWYWAGTPHGLIRELHAAFLSEAANIRSWIIITPAGRWIHWDASGEQAVLSDLGEPFSVASPNFFNRFGIIGIVETAGTAPADSSSSAELGRRVVQRWRAGHTLNTFIKLITDDSSVWGGCDWTFDFLGATPMPSSNLTQWGDVGLTWGAAGTQVDWTPPEPQ